MVGNLAIALSTARYWRVEMFFSLIEPALGAEREAAFSRLHGPYAEHQWLWRFFPAPEGTPRDFLFRRMEGDVGSRFYVVSARRPETGSEAWSVRTRDYSPQVEVGQRLRFDLRVNPVVTIKRDGKSRRDDVVMHEKKRLMQEHGLKRWADWQGHDKPAEYDLVTSACRDWLCAPRRTEPSRAEKAGFRLINESFGVDAYQQHEASRKGVRFSTADLSGELEVIDVEAFAATLQGGLGHGKAFGCGLLLVKKA